MSRFQRSRGGRPGGVYACRSCGKRTRETGLGESDCQLCAFCFVESGEQNMHLDGSHETAKSDCCPYCNPDGYRKAICETWGCGPR
ncbi:MAG: hypothetical protein JXB13_18710, partial [Phycisphaerae bacterium]|nr:hypothetical protein [Phycisphaerae bacterium]